MIFIYLVGFITSKEKSEYPTGTIILWAPAELTTNHEEVDSRMFLHITCATETLGVERITLWSLDSDVAIMCPQYCFITGGKQLFLQNSGHKKRFVPMDAITVDL